MASLTQWTGFEQSPGDGEEQGSMACCSPQGLKELDMTEQLDNTNKRFYSAEKRVLLSHLMTVITPNVLFTHAYHLEVQAP